MLTVDEAIERILSRLAPLPTETVKSANALGRRLAEEIVAPFDSPPFANSAVDGYAVRAEDAQSPPVTLRVIEEIFAGEVANGLVTSGAAMRIMTGAPVPNGADAIVMLEDTRHDPTSGTVTILDAPRFGQHVRAAGGDVRDGEIVLTAGTRIRPAEIAMLATVGRTNVTVHRSPRVAVVSTGDEVVPASGDPLPPGKIHDSNLPMLAALVADFGAILHSAAHVRDDLEAIARLFRSLSAGPNAADVIVVAGGVSAGDRDFVKPALERLGTLELWRVAAKPGKPLAFGSIGETRFFGLPGNPASVLVTFEIYVRPALAKMSGAPDFDLFRPIVAAKLAEPLEHTPGRREYVRAITTFANGHYVTRPAGEQGSAMILSLSRANSFLIVPESVERLGAGETVNVMLT